MFHLGSFAPAIKTRPNMNRHGARHSNLEGYEQGCDCSVCSRLASLGQRGRFLHLSPPAHYVIDRGQMQGARGGPGKRGGFGL